MQVVATVHKQGDPLAYYSVTATIIPVLFLALIYQTKNLQEHLKKSGHAAATYALTYVLVAVAGETASLHVLATRNPTEKANSVILYSLVLLGGLVASAPLVEYVPKAFQTEKRAVAYLFAFGVVGVIVAAALRNAGVG